MEQLTDLSDRLQIVVDRDPDFLGNLAFLVGPLSMVDPEEKQGQKTERKKSKPTRANTPVSKLDPEQVKKMCRTRFNLMTLEDLLQIIDRLQRANQGKINQPIE